MNTNEPAVTISKREYDRLLTDSKTLAALDAAGVDNWEGYEDAVDGLECDNEEPSDDGWQDHFDPEPYGANDMRGDGPRNYVPPGNN